MKKRSSLLLLASLALVLILGSLIIFLPGITRAGSKTAARPAATAPLQLAPAAVNLATLPGVNPGTQTVKFINNSSSPVNWSADALPSWVSVNPASGTTGPGVTDQLTLTFTLPSNAPQTYTTNLVLRDLSNVNSPVSIPVTVVAATASTTWYFAEGYTGSGFAEYLTLANPNNTAASVMVTYLLGSGSPLQKTYTVNPNARATLSINQELTLLGVPPGNVSMVVSSSVPIIAERPMYFTYTALAGYTIPGGSDILGATQLSQQFDFGYLDTRPGYATWLTILNQNSSPMTVTITYFAASTGKATTIKHTVGANSRGTVYVNGEAGLSAGMYSALVSLDMPGLVERPMYLKHADGYTGSADVVGVANPQTDWYFAEGYTSPTFNEYYVLSNVSTSVTAHATVTFYQGPGVPPKTVAVTLPPGQQQVVNVNQVLTSNGINNSAAVNADAAILAERFISFDYAGAIPGASDVLGAAAPSSLFYFAEGYVAPNFTEYLTLENPNAQGAYVTVTFLPSDGSAPTVKTYLIAASSRFTVLTNGVMPNLSSFSLVVESSQPIVAERPMYFNYYGNTGGSDVIGYQPFAPPLPPPPPTPTPTSTNTPTATATNTPTATPPNTPTATATNTPTATPPNTPTPTNTPSATGTPTPPPVGVGTIIGKVTDGSGNPLSGAQVSTAPASITVLTDSNGNYTLPNIPAGLYNVIASQSGYNTNYVTNIFITNSDTITANITLPVVPPYTSMDTFTRPDQQGWGTASDGHTWQDDSATMTGASSDIQGNLGFVNTYTAATDLDQWMGNSYSDQLVSVDFEVLQFGQDAFVHGPRILGRVLDSTHYIAFAINFSNNTLALWLNKGNQWALLNQLSVARLSVNQWYHSKLLLVGSLVYGKVWPAGTAEPGWMISGVQHTLTAGMGGVRTTFSNTYWDNFSTQGLTTITGKVTDSGSNPIAGATVTDGTNSVTTDANGNYVLIEPNAGATYTVTASASGFTSQSVSVTTTNQSSTTQNFTLT